MRSSSLLVAFLSSLALAVLAGCGNGSGCVIDSDCADFTQVCIQQQCVPVGTVPDAGRSDGGAREDAGPRLDAGPQEDAGASDAGASDAGPLPDGSTGDAGAAACSDITGAWTVSTIVGTCGSAAVGYGINISVGTSACDLSVASADSSSPALDGTMSVAADDNVTGTLSPGGGEAVSCMGMLGDVSITLACGGCVMTIGPTSP